MAEHLIKNRDNFNLILINLKMRERDGRVIFKWILGEHDLQM
jgi:hypothetical protein